MVLYSNLPVFILLLSKIEHQQYNSVILSAFPGAATSSSLPWWSSGRARPPGCTTASSSPRRRTETRSWESFTTPQRQAGSTRDWPRENGHGSKSGQLSDSSTRQLMHICSPQRNHWLHISVEGGWMCNKCLSSANKTPVQSSVLYHRANHVWLLFVLYWLKCSNCFWEFTVCLG